MCGNVGNYRGKEFLQAVQDVAVDQRNSDPKKSSNPSGGFTERPDVGYRPMANMCIAYSIKDDQFYIGYSGGAGGMTAYQEVTDTPQAKRRLERLSGVSFNPTDDTRNCGHPRCNCAEASAYAIALSYGQSLSDLNFVAYEPEKGPGFIKSGKTHYKKKAPCRNCMTWIGGAGGYYDGRGWQCGDGNGSCKPQDNKRKRDDEDEGPGGGRDKIRAVEVNN